LAVSSEASRGVEKHLPGEAGVWVFILGDMIVFGLFFVVFVYYRAHDLAQYTRSQSSLNRGYGAFNTLLLLTSSWIVALAVQAARQNLNKRSAKLFVLALLCGLGFVIVKMFEYGEKIRAGITLTTNDFYMYYYVFTGIHLMHVLIGMGVLVFLWSISKSEVLEEKHVNMLESGASFWHLVDILWVVLFALLYLMK
jgi:nitric oxide reductase NorE protein